MLPDAGRTFRFTLPDAGRTFRFTLPDAALLPVTLRSFSATDNRPEVVLNWTTGNEVNNGCFEVQRSVNGWQFVVVGSVPAKAGISNNYSFTDSHAIQGTVYYRLKQIGPDGREDFSAVISISRSGLPDRFVLTAQNPFTHVLNIRTAAAAKGKLLLQLLNARGERIWQKEEAIEAGSTLVPVPGVDRLTPGPYFIKGILNGATHTVKIIKQ